MIQVLNIEIIDLHTKIAWLNRKIIKMKKSLETSVEKNTIELFADFYATKLNFIIVKVKEKLQLKLETMYFRKYKNEIAKDRYKEDVSEVNLRDNNT